MMQFIALVLILSSSTLKLISRKVLNLLKPRWRGRGVPYKRSRVGLKVNVKTMKTSSGKVRKRQTTETKRRKVRGTVVKMLAVMESNPESTDPVMEFLVTGRTGRRNAMADILGPHATVTSGDLPERLQSLSTVDKDAGPSSSSQGVEQEPQDATMDCHSSSVSSSSQEGTNKTKCEGKS